MKPPFTTVQAALTGVVTANPSSQPQSTSGGGAVNSEFARRLAIIGPQQTPASTTTQTAGTTATGTTATGATDPNAQPSPQERQAMDTLAQQWFKSMQNWNPQPIAEYEDSEEEIEPS